MSSDLVSYAFVLRSLKDILQECVQGQRIIKAYARKKELSEKTRNKICDMIITDVENRLGRYKIYFHTFLYMCVNRYIQDI